MRLIGPNCLGVLNTAERHAPGRDLRRRGAPARPDRLPLPERGARHRDHRGRRAHGPRPVLLRVGRQQGRRVRQRPARVLGAGRGHPRADALPRVLRQPPALRAHRPPGEQGQADRRGQGRALAGRRPRHRLAHGRAAVRLRRHRRRPLQPVGRDPDRHDAGTLRRRRAAVGAADPGRQPRGDRDQRGRARDPLRRRLPGGGPGRRRDCPRRRAHGWRSSCRPRRPWATRWT